MSGQAPADLKLDEPEQRIYAYLHSSYVSPGVWVGSGNIAYGARMSFPKLRLCLRYLAMRGLIERHSEDDQFVRWVDDE